MTDGVMIYAKPADKFDQISRPGEESERKSLIDPTTLFKRILLKNEAL